MKTPSIAVIRPLQQMPSKNSDFENVDQYDPNDDLRFTLQQF